MLCDVHDRTIRVHRYCRYIEFSQVPQGKSGITGTVWLVRSYRYNRVDYRYEKVVPGTLCWFFLVDVPLEFSFGCDG